MSNLPTCTYIAQTRTLTAMPGGEIVAMDRREQQFAVAERQQGTGGALTGIIAQGIPQILAAAVPSGGTGGGYTSYSGSSNGDGHPIGNGTPGEIGVPSVFRGRRESHLQPARAQHRGNNPLLPALEQQMQGVNTAFKQWEEKDKNIVIDIDEIAPYLKTDEDWTEQRKKVKLAQERSHRISQERKAERKKNSWPNKAKRGIIAITRRIWSNVSKNGNNVDENESEEPRRGELSPSVSTSSNDTVQLHGEEEMVMPNVGPLLEDVGAPTTPVPNTPVTPLGRLAVTVTRSGNNLTQEPYESVFSYHADSPSPTREPESPLPSRYAIRQSQIPEDAVLATQHGLQYDISESQRQRFRGGMEERNRSRFNVTFGAFQTPVAQQRRKRTPSRTESMSGLVERSYLPTCQPTGTQQSDSSTDSVIQWAKDQGVDPKLSKKLERKYKSTSTLIKREGVPTFFGPDNMRPFSFFDRRSNDDVVEASAAGQISTMESMEPRQKRKDIRNSIEKHIKMPNYFDLGSQQNNFDPIGDVQYPEENYVVPENENDWMHTFSIIGEANAVLDPLHRSVEIREEPITIQSYANLDDSIGSLESFHGYEHGSPREIAELQPQLAISEENNQQKEIRCNQDNSLQEFVQSSKISQKHGKSSTQTIKKKNLELSKIKGPQTQPDKSSQQSNASSSVQTSGTNGTEEDSLETTTQEKLEVHEGPSKRGKWPVYRLTEPQTLDSADGKSGNNSRKCRTYIRDKALKNKEKQAYICASCKDIYKQRKKEKIDQKTDVARMIVSNDGTYFEIHPDCAKHDPDCQAVDLSTDESKRVLYTITRQIRNKEIVKKPKALQIQALKTLNDSGHLTNKECVEAVAQYGVFYHHEGTYRKANQEANSNIPNLELILKEKQISHIRNEVDGENEKEMFVRDITSKQVVCYVDQMFRLAKERGVDTLISDGAYSLAPREWGDKTQVYTVHGISPSGICVPLLHCIITSSTAKTYYEVFSLLREQMVATGFNMDNLTFVTDFERASIIASEKVFPEAIHEGCSFHYVRCLLKAKSGHLNDCMTADKVVHTWFRRIVALVYFPQQFIELTGLLEPPEGISQEAVEPCNQFIEYFKSNWLENYNRKDMWNKFMIFKNRTTNFAENYHGRMIDAAETKHPSLSELIDVINDDSFESYTRLKENDRNLRKEDLELQETVKKGMTDFFKKMQEIGIKNIPKEEIYQYLDTMSHHLPSTLK